MLAKYNLSFEGAVSYTLNPGSNPKLILNPDLNLIWMNMQSCRARRTAACLLGHQPAAIGAGARHDPSSVLIGNRRALSARTVVTRECPSGDSLQRIVTAYTAKMMSPESMVTAALLGHCARLCERR